MTTWAKLVVVVIGLVLCSWAGSNLLDATYELRLYGSPYGLLDLQRASTPAGARTVLESWAAPAQAKLFGVARSSVGWDSLLLLGAGLVLTALMLLLRGPLRTVRVAGSNWLWSARLAVALDELAGPATIAAVVATALGVVANVLYLSVLSTAAASGPEKAASPVTIAAASLLAQGKFLLIAFVVVVLTVGCLYLIGRNRKPWVKEFFEVVRVTRFSLLAVVVVGLGLCVPDQLRDAFRALVEGSAARVVITELFLVVWACTVWYTGRFLLNVSFEWTVYGPQFAFSPQTPEFWGERQWPRILGASAFLVFALGALLAWNEVADSSDAAYPRLVVLSVINVLLAVTFWVCTRFRRNIVARLRSQQFVSPRGRPFRDMPPSVKWLVRLSFLLVLALWLAVFCFQQPLAPRLGTVTLLFGASITVTIAGSLLVWLGERAKVPAVSIVCALAVLFSFTNDNHTVRRLPEVRVDQRIDLGQYVGAWHDWITTVYPSGEHPLFIVSAAGGGIRAGYWTAAVLARLQDLNPAFADHTLLVSSVSGGSLGSLVFANLVDTMQPAPARDTPADCTHHERGQYERLATELLERDFLAPTAASMLYGDFLARLLPFSLLSDRAEALEVSWERAWDAVRREAPADLQPRLWEQNPFTRSFDVLYAGEQIDPARPARSRRLPLVLLNGTIVETGTRILVSHLAHPSTFKGDLENAFDHRQAPMRMSTAALMSARFTYVSPAGTYAPRTHVVDGGYFENSGAVTALQWWAGIKDVIDKRNAQHPQEPIRPVFIYIDNNPPPQKRVQASEKRAVPPACSEYFQRFPGLLPELSSPLNALLHARGAHAVAVRHQAEKTFGDESFISFDTNVVGADTKRARLESAPLGWVLSRTAQQILDGELARNAPSFCAVIKRLPKTDRTGGL